MRHRILSALLICSLLPGAAFAEGGPEGAGQLALGDAEEQEVRQISGSVARDFDTRRLVVEEGRAKFAIPEAAAPLVGRFVTVKGVVGERLGAGTYSLNEIVWVSPQPENRQGTIKELNGRAVLTDGSGAEVALSPPSGLGSNALLFLRDRADVPLSGFLFETQEGSELVVSGISGRIDQDLAQDDQAYLSQRTPIEGDEATEEGLRYDFTNDIDADTGRNRTLPAGTPVTVTDLEIYRKARPPERVGRFREIPVGFKLDELAENERLVVFATRQDRERSPGDPTSEGWVPARKVVIGRPLVAAPVAAVLDPQQEEAQTGASPTGLADVVEQLEGGSTQQGQEQEPADGVYDGDPAEVATAQLLLRAGPSPSAGKVIVMLRGLGLELTGEREGGYLGVRTTAPLDGWVSARHLSADGCVQPSHLNLRSAPAMGDNVSVMLLRGFKVEVTAERQGAFVRVRTAAALTGYASERYLDR